MRRPCGTSVVSTSLASDLVAPHRPSGPRLACEEYVEPLPVHSGESLGEGWKAARSRRRRKAREVSIGYGSTRHAQRKSAARRDKTGLLKPSRSARATVHAPTHW